PGASPESGGRLGRVQEDEGAFRRYGAVKAVGLTCVEERSRGRGRGLFFLTGRLAPTSYHTNETRLAEAPFGLVGDDNGPRSEPLPRNRIGIVRPSCRAAGGLRRPLESRAFPTSKLTIVSTLMIRAVLSQANGLWTSITQ
ncbi:hypothetical protein THAOC_22702, partial [Thalassiosira oceanica]